MKIVEERYGRGSIMITIHLPITVWHDVIGDNTYRIELEGASMRKTIAKMDDEMPQI